MRLKKWISSKVTDFSDKFNLFVHVPPLKLYGKRQSVKTQSSNFIMKGHNS